MITLGQPEPVTIYEVVRPATEQTSITDVLLGAAMVVLGLAVAALVAGVVLAGWLILLRRFRPGGATRGDANLTRLDLERPVGEGPQSAPASASEGGGAGSSERQ